jgi:hypothetical protein
LTFTIAVGIPPPQRERVGAKIGFARSRRVVTGTATPTRPASGQAS